jgi:hypothetical protein
MKRKQALGSRGIVSVTHPCCWQSWLSASQLTAPTFTTPLSASATLRHLGASALQCPHHCACTPGKRLSPAATQSWLALSYSEQSRRLLLRGVAEATAQRCRRDHCMNQSSNSSGL